MSKNAVVYKKEPKGHSLTGSTLVLGKIKIWLGLNMVVLSKHVISKPLSFFYHFYRSRSIFFTLINNVCPELFWFSYNARIQEKDK